MRNKHMGRALRWPEKFLISLAEGTLERIAEARTEGEDARDFIRQAIEAELKRRAKRRP